MGLGCFDLQDKRAPVWCNGNLHFHEADIDNPDSKPWAEYCPQSESPKAFGKKRVSDGDWWVKARQAILTLARTGNPFTADDLTNRVGWPDEVNNIGALFNETAKGNMIREVGTTQSTRPEAHGRTIKVWCGWKQPEQGHMWSQ